MRQLLAALGAAALLTVAAPAHAVSLSDTVQFLTNHEVSYAKKGGWHGGKGWKHGRAWGHRGGWRGGPPPWAPAWGWRRKHGYRW